MSKELPYWYDRVFAALRGIMRAPTFAGILSEIIQHKHMEVEALQPQAIFLEKEAHERKSPARSFAAALRGNEPAIIAELKKASPSKGLFATEYHPAFLASTYQQGGAACLSVLTDRKYFQGSLHDLEAARATVTLPVLRKDFVIDRIQIFEAAAHGADAILLVAAVLKTDDLQQLREQASALQMDSLVEVHDRDDLQKAIDSGAEIIGVNNRDLQTFEVDIQTSIRLSYLIPASVVRVSESGIHNREAVELLNEAGYGAFLVGESLMMSPNPAESLKSLRGCK